MTKTETDMIDWIKNASYRDLLQKWRFSPAGNLLFSGKVGNFYIKTMRERREEIGNAAHVAMSKEIDEEKQEADHQNLEFRKNNK